MRGKLKAVVIQAAKKEKKGLLSVCAGLTRVRVNLTMVRVNLTMVRFNLTRVRFNLTMVTFNLTRARVNLTLVKDIISYNFITLVGVGLLVGGPQHANTELVNLHNYSL